jgi:hypothetical protein
MTDQPNDGAGDADDEKSTGPLANALPHTLSYKVRGRFEDPTGTGVLGLNTATTGSTRGVLGSVDSRTDGAAGVRGETLASTGTVYGVHGVTTSGRRDKQNQLPAGVLAESTTNADALRAESSGRAIYAKGSGLVAQEVDSPGSGFNVGLFATAEGTAGSALQALATESDTPGNSEGVFGRTKTPGDATSGIYPVGVFGLAESVTGTTLGVRGEVATRAGPGVVGRSATSGSALSYSGTTATGVTGITDKTTEAADLDLAAGVEGVGASSSTSYGVYGRTTGDGYGMYTPDDARTGGTQTVGSGVVHEQRGDPTTSELADGAVMTFNSDGSGTGSAGDLVYAVNDGGTIKTKVVVARSDAT